ncbi:MAG: hypothetical protein U0640_08265 [Phycisphaerales bacterium]
MKNMYQFIVLSVALSAFVPAALAQHAGDVGLGIENNRIVTGLFDNGAFTPGQRVFGADFGELFPNFTDEPGFDSLPGTFPVGSSIRFNVLGGSRVWNGTEFGSTIPADQISIGFGPATPVLTPLTDVLTPGFSLAVESTGEWHRHLEYTLQSPATDGVYLLAMTLTGDHVSMQESLPFWYVFNQNQDEAVHDAAIDWVNENLVPTPGASGLLFGAGGVFAARRRRSSRTK